MTTRVVTFKPKAARADPVTDKCELLRQCCPDVEIVTDVNEYGAPVVCCRLTDKETERLRQDPNVAMVEPGDGKVSACYVGEPAEADSIGRFTEVPNWGVARLGLPQTWRLATGKGRTVGVLDTAVDAAHPILRSGIIGGQNFVPGTPPESWRWAEGDHWHGTHVTGIAVQTAPEVSILVGRVLNKDGFGEYAWIIDALNMGFTVPGIDAINMSLGGLDAPDALRLVIEALTMKGIAVVCAAGNSCPWFGNPTTGNPDCRIEFPGRYAASIAVTALTGLDEIAPWSCRGPEADFTAPGVYIPSTLPNGQWGYAGGTSMAAPFVTGIVALLKSKFLAASLLELGERAISTVERLNGQVGHHPHYGWGLPRPGVALLNG